MRNSKCPHCGVKLGNYQYADACPHCQAGLEENTRPLVSAPVRRCKTDEEASFPVRLFRQIRRVIES